MADTESFDEDWEEWDPSKGSFLHHVVAGSCAGVMEHVAMFPVDTYKTHQQAKCNGNEQPTFRKLVHRRGFWRMWRGAQVMAGASVPAHAAYFSVYEAMKQALRVDQPGHHPLAAAACGAAATTLHDMIMTPMDVVKQRLQLGFYQSARDCTRTILRTEGPAALFRSLPTTLAMNVPNAAIVVSVNESLKKLVNPGGQFDLLVYLACGGAAGAAAALGTNPMDVVKTRLQTQLLGCPSQGVACGRAESPAVPHASRKPGADPFGAHRGLSTASQPATPRYRGMFDAAAKIWSEDGLRGFWRGATARMLREAPAVGISWATYESVKHVLVANSGSHGGGGGHDNPAVSVDR